MIPIYTFLRYISPTNINLIELAPGFLRKDKILSILEIPQAVSEDQFFIPGFRLYALLSSRETK